MTSTSVSTDSRLSDENIDRIALRVKTIMTSEIKFIIDSSICETKKEFDDKIRKLEISYDAKIQKLESENSNLREEVEDLWSELCGLKQDIVNMKWRNDENEQYSRRNSLRNQVYGIVQTLMRRSDVASTSVRRILMCLLCTISGARSKMCKYNVLSHYIHRKTINIQTKLNEKPGYISKPLSRLTWNRNSERNRQSVGMFVVTAVDCYFS